jgi:dolichol kinase
MDETLAVPIVAAAERQRTGARIFRGALVFNTMLTLFWVVALATGSNSVFARGYRVDLAAIGRVSSGILFFYVVWGLIWWAVKRALLRRFVGFTPDEVRASFSSRQRAPYDVSSLVARYSERRIRIADMIGRRGRFITLAAAGFFYLYLQVARDPTPGFATAFLQDNLFDAVVTTWVFLAFYHADGLVAAWFYGPQSRVMDGGLARANCLLITTLWSLFKFVMVPIGAALATIYPRQEFAAVFAMIWGSYIATDAMAEIVGSLIGRQRIRVWGVGDVNRKSVAGTVGGFLGGFALCAAVVAANGLGTPWLILAVAIALSNTALELGSPRGTDDFTMATSNALICLAFGTWLH